MSEALRRSGAAFALVFGSHARGDQHAGRVDLLVLNSAPLELAGRVALEGQLLYDDDPEARVHWVATTRKIYADELPRLRRSHREFAESLRRGG